MDGWQRIPDAQLKLEADHAACTRLGGGLPSNPDNWRGLSWDEGFRLCMRTKGWVKQ